MLNFKKIDREDYPLLNAYLNNYPSRQCDRSVGTIIMWHEYYKNYYMENEKLDENSANSKSQAFVNNLGSSYVYENVMFVMIDDLLIEKAEVTEKPKTYVSITETIAEADKPVTE